MRISTARRWPDRSERAASLLLKVTPMTDAQTLELCRKWQDAFTRHDLPMLLTLYAENVVLESPMAGNMAGREAVVNASANLFGAFPDMDITFEPPVVDEDRAAITA